MMIITDCPKCKTDFMYDPNTDYHLVKGNMPINTGALGLSDEDLRDHEGPIVICQRCNEDEFAANIIEEFVKLAEAGHPEFQEEYTTGWDLMENEKKQIKRLRGLTLKNN